MVASKTGGFLGPARVLVTETKREADGQLRAGSTVWVVRGRRLLKCCVEQLRPATEREAVLEHVTTDEDNKAPWTIPRLVDQLGSHEYEDLTGQVPSATEWEQAQGDDEGDIPMFQCRPQGYGTGTNDHWIQQTPVTWRQGNQLHVSEVSHPQVQDSRPRHGGPI